MLSKRKQIEHLQWQRKLLEEKLDEEKARYTDVLHRLKISMEENEILKNEIEQQRKWIRIYQIALNGLYKIWNS